MGMKARWPLLAAAVLFVLGFIVPYYLMEQTAESAEGWEGIWLILAAPAIYGWVAAIFWGIAVILVIVAIVVYVRGKKKRRRK
jgi:uncharacterized membrane protein